MLYEMTIVVRSRSIFGPALIVAAVWEAMAEWQFGLFVPSVIRHESDGDCGKTFSLLACDEVPEQCRSHSISSSGPRKPPEIHEFADFLNPTWLDDFDC